MVPILVLTKINKIFICYMVSGKWFPNYRSNYYTIKLIFYHILRIENQANNGILLFIFMMVTRPKIIEVNHFPTSSKYFSILRLELNQPPVFALAPHLTSCETELHYLRQISELIIMFLMPRCYSLAPASHLMREILACKGKVS